MGRIGKPELKKYRESAKQELYGRILPFWMQYGPDERYGGFLGEISNDLTVRPDSPKSAVLATRILWTFSAAFRKSGDPRFLPMAEKAIQTVENHFWDKINGGLYWWLDHQNKPLEDDKKIYAQAFAIYALTEHAEAAGSEKSLSLAKILFESIEEKACDAQGGGYFDFFNADWSPKGNASLADDTDMPAEKTMNTHLHLLEGYARLYTAWQDERLAARLGLLIDLHLEKILNPKTHHLMLFFDKNWNPISDKISYGHDIEASWLICEAAQALRDGGRIRAAEKAAAYMAAGVMSEAQDTDGGILNEGGPGGITDTDKHWWPQAEAAVGFLNAYQLTGDEAFLDASMKTWRFIQEKLVDREFGEWFWKTNRQGLPDQVSPKVSPWKCPYHNGRACLEIMDRLDAILDKT
ncbi:AGE family epimerase/isomerase [bacterium]|nr:AGE family epimerase/isomerase [bacterium]